MGVVQGAFERVGGPEDEYDLLRKLFLTGAAIHTEALLQLSLRKDDKKDDLGRVWKTLKETPAFEKDYEMATRWYFKCYQRS
jgi:hypothetical protein